MSNTSEKTKDLDKLFPKNFDFFIEKEYQPLRKEVANNIKEQRSLSIFAITTVLTFLTATVSFDNVSSEVCLIPLVLLCVLSAKTYELKKSNIRIISYVNYMLENGDLDCWEKMLLQWRKDEEKGFFTTISNMAATFEYVLMALACVAFYLIESHSVKNVSMVEKNLSKLTASPVKHDVVYCVFIIGYIVITLSIIIIVSKNHWRLSPKEIEKNIGNWKNVKCKDNKNMQMEQRKKEKKKMSRKVVPKIKKRIHDNVACGLCITVSVIIPILVFRLKNHLVSALSKVSVSTPGTSTSKGSSIVFENSSAYVERYATPFASCICLIISLLIVFVVIGLGLKCLKKYGYYLQNANGWLSLIEVVVVIFSAFVLIYSYDGEMDYEGYGIYSQEIEEKSFVEIQPGPTIAGHVKVKGADNPSYNLLIKMSDIAHALMHNIELYIGIISAMILPLKIWGSKEELNTLNIRG